MYTLSTLHCQSSAFYLHPADRHSCMLHAPAIATGGATPGTISVGQEGMREAYLVPAALAAAVLAMPPGPSCSTIPEHVCHARDRHALVHEG